MKLGGPFKRLSCCSGCSHSFVRGGVKMHVRAAKGRLEVWAWNVCRDKRDVRYGLV